MIRKVETKDIQTIQSWFLARNIVDQSDMFSTIGYIVPDIAAGFLYTTNSQVAIIEHLITNPIYHKEIRDKALDEVVLSIIKEAKRLHFTNLLGITEFDVVTQRALKLGFEKQPNPFTVINYNLEGK